MTTNHATHSDLYGLYNIVQSSMVLYPKELITAQLRDFFSRDSNYHFATDHFGFPQTPDQTNLPQSVGYQDNITTRLYINSAHRYDIIYYPAILVRHGGASSVPISLNREATCIQYEDLVFEDGYGNIKTLSMPSSFIFAGAWEGTINVDILARDPRTRDDLVELVSMLFVDLSYEDMKKSGVVIKPSGGITAGVPSETIDRTDPLFKQTIALSYRSEWRREIPIRNIIDVVNISVEFGRITPVEEPIAPNLTINIQETLAQAIAAL
jgi:hypothetical protein